MSERVSIRVVLKSDVLSSNNVSEWFKSITYFEPKNMRGKSLTNNKLQKYNTKKFFEGISKELDSKDIVKISISDEQNSISLIRGAYNPEIAWITYSLTSELFEQNKSNLLEFIENIMKRYDGIVANICSLEDEFWQDNEDIDYYRLNGKSLEGIHMKGSPIFEDNIIVDTEYNPGHSHKPNGIWFGSCWMMWYGKEYFKYIPKEVLANFRNCYESKLFTNDLIRITLYDNLWDYDKQENRERQWNFRKSVGVDNIACILEDSDNIKKNMDTSIEIFDGFFEHGGVRLMKYYYSSEGKLIPKSQAIEVKIYELGEKGKLLWSESEKIY